MTDDYRQRIKQSVERRVGKVFRNETPIPEVAGYMLILSSGLRIRITPNDGFIITLPDGHSHQFTLADGNHIASWVIDRLNERFGKPCPRCNGTGTYEKSVKSSLNCWDDVEVECHVCEGTGFVKEGE